MKLKGVNRYHENPYAPIIKQSLGAEKKGRGKRNDKPVKRPRRKTHHRGVTHLTGIVHAISAQNITADTYE